jgi:hypothetical protein
MKKIDIKITNYYNSKINNSNKLSYGKPFISYRNYTKSIIIQFLVKKTI